MSAIARDACASVVTRGLHRFAVTAVLKHLGKGVSIDYEN